MKSPDHELGYRLKAARENRHLTQERLAEMVGIAITRLLSQCNDKQLLIIKAVIETLLQFNNEL